MDNGFAGNVLCYLNDSVKNHPDRIAFEDKTNKISYKELYTKSTRLAKTIFQSGIRKSPIGVFAGRNIDTIIYFFAVLYSGNYYVPIDASMPIEKISSIINDARFDMIVGDESNSQLVSQLQFNKIFISIENADEEGYDNSANIEEQDPIYMVYTSGSTGKPKGVLKSHGAVISFIEAYSTTFSFLEHEVIGNQTPFFFDASAKDIYLSIRIAATTVIIPSEMFLMGTPVIELLNERMVTFICWVPTALSIIAQMRILSFIKPKYLRKCFFIGEVMPMKHLNYWRKNLQDVEYVNLYGQSEISGFCCYYPVNTSFEDSDVLPIGKALPNCDVILLDKDKNTIQTPGNIGEIYIKSEALATEYFNDREKTEKTFVSLEKEIGRFFKTGDLAEYDQNHDLVFAARTDFQIKHMGHRIELGEIEVVAGALEEIQRCCCLYDFNKKRIVLFCEIDKSQAAIDNKEKGKEIQSILRKKLSSYMVPNKVEIIDSIPLNANGKIDRTLLKTLL